MNHALVSCAGCISSHIYFVQSNFYITLPTVSVHRVILSFCLPLLTCYDRFPTGQQHFSKLSQIVPFAHFPLISRISSFRRKYCGQYPNQGYMKQQYFRRKDNIRDMRGKYAKGIRRGAKLRQFAEMLLSSGKTVITYQLRTEKGKDHPMYCNSG